MENFVFLMTNRNKNYFIKLFFLDTPLLKKFNYELYFILTIHNSTKNNYSFFKNNYSNNK